MSQTIMEDAPSPAAPGSRPSFSSFWKRTKEATASATREVTFVPIDIPRITKGRSTKKQTKASASPDSNGNDSPDGARSSGRARAGGRVSDQGEAGSAEDQENSEEADEPGNRSRESNQGTAKEKSQVRRAQVRRAQIQHRKRKADYMRQLELDIDMLRDLITTTEQDMKNIQKDNDAIRMQLGIVTVVQNDRSTVNVGAGVVGFNGGGAAATTSSSSSSSSPPGGGNTDTAMSDEPAHSATPTQSDPIPIATTTVAVSDAAVDKIASSLSPLSISPGNTVTGTSPAGTSHTSTSYDSQDSASSIFTGIDLDDINVSVVMDEAVGNPVYQISSISPDTSLTMFPSEFNDAMTQSLQVSPFDTGYLPQFETELAMASQPPAGREVAHSTTAYFLPDLTVPETHAIVNLILALEHVCWGHACHQYFEPSSETEMRADQGHVMMATSLFLREANDSVFSTIESSTKGTSAFTTNTDPANIETTRSYINSHQASKGLTWQAPDVTLQTLYGLALSLNPLSEVELAPVQAWFELASRYPLSILLRPDVVENLKRELVGVVRCLYFGAVMERKAFESVVQRVVEPAMQAQEQDAAVSRAVARVGVY